METKSFDELRRDHPDAIILKRCHDFYMAVDEDAKIAADTLGLIVTTSKGDNRKCVAFPKHSLDTYLPKLVRAGHRVAICEI